MFDENMSAFDRPQSVRQWCAALGLNPRKVAAVGPMVPRVKEEFIYQVLDGEQIFYRPRVAASRRDSAGVLLNVLIDSPREIDRDRVPPDIDAESEGPWKIVLPDMSDDADELNSQGDALTTQYAVKAQEIPDEGETQSTLCKVRRRRRRFHGRCYKCQVMGHQARSCKTYKNSTIQKSYYEPSVCESDSPEEDRVLSREKTTVENPIGMKVAPETFDTPDRSKVLGLGKRRSPGKANVRVPGNNSDKDIFDCFAVQACQGIRQVADLSKGRK
ncbi:hypothetical protein XELAEV_18012335mg [Xenopus laevis]|uniref:CCHC-type domain-containing protein n=1 Tax=Xenopus laevis TaxID=8355 RepID=A0A974HY16_XENLA|nr:hypothetical protein XELAEV_18012335mg [Xenopus laevis]